MHEFDPNGAIKAYRRERQRQDTIHTVLFCCAIGIGIIILYALTDIGMSMWEGWAR